MLGLIHTASATAALLAGAVVLLRAKGTASHRRVGYVYVGSMVILNVTALMIYRLTGGFGVFHVAALLSLATVLAGIVPAIRRRGPGWIQRHYYLMSYSYVGLVAAAGSEVTTRLAPAAFWWAVAAATVVVCIIGAGMVRSRASGILAMFTR